MKTFKFYSQLSQVDCGSTCLKMIAKHYGKIIHIDYLRGLNFISNQGVFLSDLSRAAEEIGFKTLKAKIETNKIDKLPLPFIAHFNQNHFVVVYKIKRQKIYIADPEVGKIILSYNDFENKFCEKSNDKHGKVLLFETTPEFYNLELNNKEEISKTDILLHFIYYLKPYKKLIFQLFLGLLTATIIQLMLPFLSQLVIDKGINGNNINLIYLILIAQLLLTFGGTLIFFVRNWIFLQIGTKVSISIVSDFLIKVMEMPVSFFDNRPISDILQRIWDNKKIDSFLTGHVLNIIFSILTLIVFGSILFYYSTIIFGVFFSGSLLYVFWVLFFQKKRKKLDHKLFKLNSDNTSDLIQILEGIREIKLSNSSRQKRWEWEKLQLTIYKTHKKNLLVNQTQLSGGMLINQIKNIFISFIAARSVLYGEITFGTMIAIQFIVASVNTPIESFISFINSFQAAELSFRRINDIVEETYIEEKSSNKNVFIPPKELSFNIINLNFSFIDDINNLVLKDINLTINSGEVTAIVGESGSGKTSLLKLLLKFYKPSKGKIVIGNSNLDNIDSSWWYENCGAVLQDSFIFSKSIVYNICLSDSIIDKEKLIDICKLTNIEQFIESLPEQYNTKIGKNGLGLSQGQKQRVLIARALYKDPQFFFFDEATNALDSKNESEIIEKIMPVLNKKTTIIVAHRLNTIKNADKIIVMDNGFVVEEGTHDSLIKRKSKYYYLVKKQMS